MNSQTRMSIEKETTQHLVEDANRLGYTIATIDTTNDLAIEIRPAALMPYTPPLYRDWQTGQWTIQTGSSRKRVDEGSESACFEE